MMMSKGLVAFSLFILVVYSIYYDLEMGTLKARTTPVSTELTEPVESNPTTKNPSQPHKEIKIKPGETVLSVVELIHNGNVPVSIDQIVADFQNLNPNTDVHKIQIGQTYLFPLY
jgi:hypothetical protein